MHSIQINEIATALAKAQSAMKAAKFDAVNPHFKSRYATLAAVTEAAKPLAANGIAYTHTLERVLVGDANGTDLFLRTVLIHTSGQWIDSYWPLPSPTTIKPQEFMSHLTYAKRGSISALAGIASDEDDDANEAEKVEIAPRQQELAKPVPLTKAEREDLEFYLKECTPDKVKRFLLWLNVKSVDDIGRHQYDLAISGIKKAIGDLGQVDGTAKANPATKISE